MNSNIIVIKKEKPFLIGIEQIILIEAFISIILLKWRLLEEDSLGRVLKIRVTPRYYKALCNVNGRIKFEDAIVKI